MNLQIDARQCAMLEEMGVKVWGPSAPTPSLPSGLGDDAPPSPPQGGKAASSAAAVAVARPAKGSVAPRASVPLAARSISGAVEGMDWEALEQAVAGCQACGLCKSRKNTVFGFGNRQANWLVVGEAPGENEDLQGEPIVGQAGILLDNMLKSLGLSRAGEDAQAVYIANVLKCRPPANRNPQPEEVLQCEPYLRRQVALLQPQIILALGRFAAQSLLQSSVADVASLPLGKLRGQVHRYEGVPVVVSYHPAYLLRTPQDKAKAWADLCLALSVMQSRAGL
ncbi:MAG: uracil-DNA glycosylase [Curvibacter sp.]|jgi:uracil-DNA glycosylase family 4|nr:uracil-DNA glycosylase [Curvibacter sp.]